MSYKVMIKNYGDKIYEGKEAGDVHQTYPILSLNQLVPPSQRQGRHLCRLQIQDQPLFLPIGNASYVYIINSL